MDDENPELPSSESSLPIPFKKEDVFKAPPLKKHQVDPPLDYTPPSTLLIPTKDHGWWFEVVKGGVIVEEIHLTGKSFFTIGRLPSCDISMLHDSVSRYHCILQWMQPNECYLYDLSSHGTYLNKKRIPKQTYVQVFDGDFVKFGESSRNYIVHGIEKSFADLPTSSTQSSTKSSSSMASSTPLSTKLEEVSWGMHELEDNDANDEDTINPLNPRASFVEFYVDEPKKILQQWLTSRGVEMKVKSKTSSEDEVYVRVQISKEDVDQEGTYVDEDLVGEAVTTSKKESEKQAMLQVLHQLNRLGQLDETKVAVQKAHFKSLLKEMDEEVEKDEYYDRSQKPTRSYPSTGSLSSKKPKLETLESLNQQLQQALQRQSECNTEIQTLQSTSISNLDLMNEEDSLDAFMQTLASQQHQERLEALKKESSELNASIALLTKYIALVTPRAHLTSSSLSCSSTTDHPSVPLSLKLDSQVNTTPPSSSPSPPTARSGSNTQVTEQPQSIQDNLTPLHVNKGPVVSNPILSSTRVSHPTRFQALNETKHDPEDVKSLDEEDLEETVPKVIEWLPPKDQTGDGKTKLNDLYGY